ncbi:MAG: AI-2E family transporter [Bacteroidales bacterium]
MNGNELKLSSYVKVAVILIGLFALFTLLYVAEGIIVPLIFSVIIAIVLHPLVKMMVRVKINRVLAITIIIILTIIVLFVLSTLLIAQVSRFAESWPLLVAKFTEAINDMVIWASGYFDINADRFYGWLAQSMEKIIDSGVSSIGQTIVTIGGWFVMLFLIPVYVLYVLVFHIFIHIIDNFYIVPKIVASRVRINALFFHNCDDCRVCFMGYIGYVSSYSAPCHCQAGI